MNWRAQAVAAAAILAVSAYWAFRQARSWATQELSPFHRHLERLDATIPRDARILLPISYGNRHYNTVVQLNTRLYPRVVYTFPPGVETLEESAAWIAEKKLDWMVSWGGLDFDLGKAYSRRIDDDR